MSHRNPAHEEAFELLSNSRDNGFLEETLKMSDHEIAGDMIEKTGTKTPLNVLAAGVRLARKEFEK